MILLVTSYWEIIFFHHPPIKMKKISNLVRWLMMRWDCIFFSLSIVSNIISSTHQPSHYPSYHHQHLTIYHLITYHLISSPITSSHKNRNGLSCQSSWIGTWGCFIESRLVRYERMRKRDIFIYEIINHLISTISSDWPSHNHHLNLSQSTTILSTISSTTISSTIINISHYRGDQCS